jgi:hypothetical protein
VLYLPGSYFSIPLTKFFLLTAKNKELEVKKKRKSADKLEAKSAR